MTERELIITRFDDSKSPNQEYRELKPSEVAKLNSNRELHSVQDLIFQKKRALDKELHKKGWGSMSDFMSDLFAKGFDTMKIEFDTIKAEVDSRFQ
ncbi:MAG: hypothetical protein ACUZ8H_05515 [Candidatus Anammoxibacter sp.]